MSQSVDVCIYGATGAGCAAAVAAKQEGASVIIIEPGRWLGGMLGAGIAAPPWQDCPEPLASYGIGGLTRKHIYQFGTIPPVIRNKFAKWIDEQCVPILYEHRIKSVTRDNPNDQSIQAAQFGFAPPDKWGIPSPEFVNESSETVQAQIFIDASYEGDLMSSAGVSYRTGRESNITYGEILAGIREPTNWVPIDPYTVSGDPTSGILPLIEEDHGLPLGCGDEYTHSYNFRLYSTNESRRCIQISPPQDYEPGEYELVGRLVAHIVKDDTSELESMRQLLKIFPGNHEIYGSHNYSRQSLVSTAPLGISRHYQDSDWRTRSAIWRNHIDYLRGLHHFLCTDTRVPDAFQKLTALTGLDKVMHPETDGWPHQLYVRAARRMNGRYTLTQADVFNKTSIDDGVGLAQFGVDTWPARRYLCRSPETGHIGVANEGDMFLGFQGTGTPYPVPYRAITPMVDECSNLLVPVCFSASHIAYSSARMEPVFCVLGESAGAAAAIAARHGTSVQDIDVEKLQRCLAERGQILAWS